MSKKKGIDEVMEWKKRTEKDQWKHWN